MQERLQKIIARSKGISRRKAEELIALGKVVVNGKKVTELGTKVHPQQSKIVVNGKPIASLPYYQYLIFNKPRQCMVTRDDPEGRKTIYDYLPNKFHHLKPVGRLDYDSQGLLLLTNDGDLAQKLTHPRYKHSKIYEVKVTPPANPRQLTRLKEGVIIDGFRTLPAEISVLRTNPLSCWLEIKLEEGRNRQIRKMCEKVGLTVKTLMRTQMGDLTLKGVTPGKYRLLDEKPLSDI